MRKITKKGINQYRSNNITDLYPPKLPTRLMTAMITTPRIRDKRYNLKLLTRHFPQLCIPQKPSPPAKQDSGDLLSSRATIQNCIWQRRLVEEQLQNQSSNTNPIMTLANIIWNWKVHKWLTATNAPRRLPKSMIITNWESDKPYSQPYIPNVTDDSENIPELQIQAMTPISPNDS